MYPSKRIQHQQILIACNDRRALPGQRRRQHHIVVTVATCRSIEGARHHERERLREQLSRAPHIGRPLSELSLEHVAKFVEQRLRRDDDMLADAVFEEFLAGAAGDQRRDQHVRVEQQSHETRVNTSSSV